MADLRVLTLALTLGPLVACGMFAPPFTPQPPRIEGRVLDARTREPVEGAEIFAGYELGWPRREGEAGPVFLDAYRSTTTDAGGRFEFPPRFDEDQARIDPERAVRAARLKLVDRRYGAQWIYQPRPIARWTGLEFEVAPDPESLALMQQPSGVNRLCSFHGDLAASVRCCEIVYGAEAQVCVSLREDLDRIRNRGRR